MNSLQFGLLERQECLTGERSRSTVCRPTGSCRVGRYQLHVRVDTVQHVSRAVWRQK